MTCSLWASHNVVEVHCEVESQPQTCWVRCRQCYKRVLVRELVRFECSACQVLLRIQASKLGKVPVIIAAPDVRLDSYPAKYMRVDPHLGVENLFFSIVRCRHQGSLKESYDVSAQGVNVLLDKLLLDAHKLDLLPCG